VLGALGSMVLLAIYHIRHYNMHFLPYRKRLSMFERRGFYAPPIVSVMESWKRNDGEEGGDSSESAGVGYSLSVCVWEALQFCCWPKPKSVCVVYVGVLKAGLKNL
jgi:hypothetical protein